MITGLSLEDFRSNIHDFARPNRFEVLITPPSVFKYKASDYDLLTWLAETAQIPSRTQGEISTKYFGMELKLPGDYAKENLTIGFLNSYGWEGRNFFESWMEMIQGVTKDNRKTNSKKLIDDSFIEVTQLGRTADSTLKTYKFLNVFPTNLSSIELSMGNENQIEKFNVSFAYSHYELVDKG